MSQNNLESIPNINQINDDPQTNANQNTTTETNEPIDKSQKIITLSNYNPDDPNEPILTSPKSLDSCLRQGIRPKDLLRMTRKELKKIWGKEKKMDDNDWKIIEEHLEKRRIKKIEMLNEVREEIIEEEKLGLWKPGALQNTNNLRIQTSELSVSKYSNQSLTLIQNEKKMLEKIKKRQELEIQKMIDYEIKQEMTRQDNIKKEENHKRRELERLKAIAIKRKEEEELRRKKELEKKLIEERAISEEMKKRQIEFVKEQERLQKRKEEDEIRMKEKKKLEKLMEEKNEEARRKTEMIFIEQQKELMKRKEIMDEKERKQKEFTEWRQKEIQKSNEEKAKEHFKKLELTKKYNDDLLENKRNTYLEKEQKTQQKQILYEKSKNMYFQELGKKAEEKSKKIKDVLNQNNQLAEQKIQEYNKKQEKELQKKEKIRDYFSVIEENRRKQNEAKSQKILHVISANDGIIEARKTQILKKMSETETKLKRVEEKKNKEIHERQNSEFLKNLDRNENIQRMIEISELKKAKMMEKIKLDYMRSDTIMKERSEMIKMKQELRKKLDYERERILKEFESKKKINKLDFTEFAKSHDIPLSPTHKKYIERQNFSQLAADPFHLETSVVNKENESPGIQENNDKEQNESEPIEKTNTNIEAS